MKELPLVLRSGSGVLALCLLLLPPVLRAEEAAGKLSKTEEKHDATKDGKQEGGEKAGSQDAAARANAKEAENLKQVMAKYDANHNGKLDRDERAKKREDEVLAARTERQALEGEARFQRKMQKLRGNDVPKVRKH